MKTTSKKLTPEQLKRRRIDRAMKKLDNEKRLKEFRDFVNKPPREGREKYIGNTLVNRMDLYAFMQQVVAAEKILKDERDAKHDAKWFAYLRESNECMKQANKALEEIKDTPSSLLSGAREDALWAEFRLLLDKDQRAHELIKASHDRDSDRDKALAAASMFLQYLKTSNDLSLDTDFRFVSDN